MSLLQAAQQALMYLEAYAEGEDVKPYECEGTVLTLRQAIAQAEQQEPDYFGLTHDHTWLSIDKKQYDKLKPEGRMACYTAPPQPKAEQQEPVARVTGYHGGRCVVEPLNRALVLPIDMALYAAHVQQVTRADLKAAFKEGFERAADLYAPNDGQEPYAYEVWDVQDQSFTMIYATQLKEFHWIEPENIARVLYAAPVRTKDLTDDEIMDLVRDECVVMRWPSTPLFIARAVIAAHKEKNK